MSITRHLDGSRTNNALRNLAWGTPSQNMLDRLPHGTDSLACRTHCHQGHEFTEENTRWRPPRADGRATRVCRACARARSIAARAHKAEVVETDAINWTSTTWGDPRTCVHISSTGSHVNAEAEEADS